MINKQRPNEVMNHSQVLGLRGLRLAGNDLEDPEDCGNLFCQPSVSIEHQQFGRKVRAAWRGIRGAVADLGAYCSFVEEPDKRSPGCQRRGQYRGQRRSDAGRCVHPSVWRLHVVRVRRTYDLLITKHVLATVEGAKLAHVAEFHGVLRQAPALWRWICAVRIQDLRHRSPSFLSRRRTSKHSRILRGWVVRMHGGGQLFGGRHSHCLAGRGQEPGVYRRKQ